MRRQSIDLFVVIVIAGLSAMLALVMPANSIVRLICALPLVFFLPGYAITAALLQMRSLGNVERLLFSLGLSVAMTALSGLLLNLTPWGLQSTTWAIMLAVIVVLTSAIAWLRRKPDTTIKNVKIERNFNLRLRDGLFLGMAVLVTGAAIGLTRLPVAPNGITGYTQLWMITANPNNTNDFRLGLTSAEFTDTRYRLQVSISGQVVKEWPELSLKPGETWETAISLPSDQFGSGPIIADLYKLDNPGTLYRHVTLWR
jgi:uncharacterized membrane protein